MVSITEQRCRLVWLNGRVPQHTSTRGSRQDYKQVDITQNGIHQKSRRLLFSGFDINLTVLERAFPYNQPAAEVTP